jgi:predicted phosphate transport protein (TIGR00153 family)
MRLLPHDATFFDLFDAQVDAVVQAAAALRRLAEDFGRLEEELKALDEIEHRADNITHELANRVDATFVTPFDKEDISHLAGILDDIVDFIEEAVSRMHLCKVEAPPPEFLSLARLMTEIANLVAEAVKGLRKIKQRDRLRQLFVEIHRIENECDDLYIQALGQLFDLPDPTPAALLRLMKWREVLDRLEMAIDRCEDAANVVERTVVKYR